MHRYRNLAFSLIMAFAMTIPLFASSTSAEFDKFTPTLLKWREPVIKVAISISLVEPNSNIKLDSRVLDAVRRSFATWAETADVTFQFEFSELTNVSPDGALGDGVNLITIAQSPANVLLFSNNQQPEAARTRVFYNMSGYISEADIVLNPFEQFSTDGTFGTFDLQSTLTHEIGHMLGLRHSKVLGATMANGLGRNGLFGTSDIRLRTLSDSDLSAIRELYGASDDDLCCGSISGIATGKVAAKRPGRAASGISIWAEDADSGKVIGLVDADEDGVFLLSGLPISSYKVFWQSYDDKMGTNIGELGQVDLADGEGRFLFAVSTPRRLPFSLNYIGKTGRLTNSAVTLRRGEEHNVIVGGRGLDPRSTLFEISSSYFALEPASFELFDVGNGIQAMELIITVDDLVPAGAYSIWAIRPDGTRSSLVGALNIE